MANKTKKFQDVSLEKVSDNTIVSDKSDNSVVLPVDFVEQNEVSSPAKEKEADGKKRPLFKHDKSKKKKTNVDAKEEESLIDKEFDEAIKGKKQKKEKKKLSWKRRLLNLGAITMMGVVTGCVLGYWYHNNLYSNVDPEMSEEDILLLYDDIGDAFVKATGGELSESERADWVAKAKAHGTTPANLSASENINLALFNIGLAKSYRIEGNGAVSTIANQSVYGLHAFDGQTYESIAISFGMKSVAHQLVMDKGSNMVKYTNAAPKKLQDGSASADWDKGSKKSLTLEECKAFAGGLPSSIHPYIISSKTIVDEASVAIETLTDEEGNLTYKMQFDLKPFESTRFYVRQMKMVSTLPDMPSFGSGYVKQTFIIDENWHLVQIDVEEKYSQIAFGVSASCVGTLTTTFENVVY